MAFVLWQIVKVTFPNDRTACALFIALSMFFPNILQLFSIINNDGLSVLWTTAAIFIAVLICKHDKPYPSWFLGCGLFLSLATITKFTAFIPAMVIGTMFVIDIVINRRWVNYGKGVLWMSLPLILIGVGYIMNNYIRYDDPTLSNMLISQAGSGRVVEPQGILKTSLLIFVSSQ